MPLIVSTKSNGGRTVAEASGLKRVRPERAHVVRSQLLINWGHRDLLFRNNQRVLNKPEAIAKAVNKLTTLRELTDAAVEVPDWDQNFDRLRERHPRQRILARTVLNGSGGEGIVVIEPNQEAVPAPLYVAYVPKTAELRVHVFGQRAILVQQKKVTLEARQDRERTTLQRVVRSHANGWVFAENITVPEHLLNLSKEKAIGAVRALGLDFGAVDMLLTDTRSYVCEVNTRPGVEATATTAAYAAAIKEFCDANR